MMMLCQHLLKFKSMFCLYLEVAMLLWRLPHSLQLSATRHIAASSLRPFDL